MDTKPREKILASGIQSLKFDELIAVILGRGTKKESVFEISQRISGEYGMNKLASIKSLKDFQEFHQLSFVHASQLTASIELGRRIYSQNPKQFSTFKDITKYVENMRTLKKESFRGIYLSTCLEILADEIICIGSLDKNIVHPREVFVPAIEYSAYGIVLVHNHPSGNPEPSDCDLRITNQLQKAAQILRIRLFDHIIMAKNGTFSFHEAGLLAHSLV